MGKNSDSGRVSLLSGRIGRYRVESPSLSGCMPGGPTGPQAAMHAGREAWPVGPLKGFVPMSIGK
jgi:hypothetical protein